MKVKFDFSLFSGPNAAYGQVSGEIELPSTPNRGAGLDLMPQHAETVSALHNLRVRSILPPVAPGSAPIVMLEDVVAATDGDARELFALLARDYGYDAYPYGDDEPDPLSSPIV